MLQKHVGCFRECSGETRSPGGLWEGFLEKHIEAEVTTGVNLGEEGSGFLPMLECRGQAGER